MYGRYTKELGEFAKEEALKLEKQRRKEERLRNEELHKYRGKCASKLASAFGFIWKHTFAKLGEDWVFLALLGLIMAFLSFIMDHGINMCNKGRCHINLRNHYVAYIITAFDATVMSSIITFELVRRGVSDSLVAMCTAPKTFVFTMLRLFKMDNLNLMPIYNANQIEFHAVETVIFQLSLSLKFIKLWSASDHHFPRYLVYNCFLPRSVIGTRMAKARECTSNHALGSLDNSVGTSFGNFVLFNPMEIDVHYIDNVDESLEEQTGFSHKKLRPYHTAKKKIGPTTLQLPKLFADVYLFFYLFRKMTRLSVPECGLSSCQLKLPCVVGECDLPQCKPLRPTQLTVAVSLSKIQTSDTHNSSSRYNTQDDFDGSGQTLMFWNTTSLLRHLSFKFCDVVVVDGLWWCRFLLKTSSPLADLTTHPFAQYMAWVALPVCLILFSAGFVHIVAPQSIGSGIPEMKTILRGVSLKEYLTFRTLVAKVIGLTATLGSGLPLGKEGPFVHIASIAATLLSKLVTSFQGIYENESRNTEMLAAACAVGVASCFGAPIGGVLFSIEVTTVYFAVRNYWRGFFTAVCGATVFRLLAVWFQKEDTVKAFFQTNFTMDFPFDPQELVVYSLMGVVCGLGGAGYVWSHRQYVLFMRRNKKMNSFLQKNRFLYPGIVALLASTVSFPLGLGQYMAGDLNTHDQVAGLFSNFTWTKGYISVEESDILRHWTTKNTDVFVSLCGFMLYTWFFSIVCSTIPVPSGSFIPVFKIGAAFGRVVGELIHLSFPKGVRHGKLNTPIIPGEISTDTLLLTRGYATVGAAAMAGAVTHTISVSVIVFEMTGQITHIIPIMIAVLIANAIAALLQPSLYDSIILIKKLPYLPDLLPSSSGMYNIYVEDFMVRDVKFIWHNMSYHELKSVLKENRRLRVFPLVENPDTMILLGSIQRIELIKVIERHVGRERRLQVVAQWQKEAQERAREEEKKRRESEQRQRRPSRFEVIPAPDILRVKQMSNQELDSGLQPHFPIFGCQPKKSILKKTNSFNLRNFSPVLTPTVTPYTTVTGAESRIRMAFEAIFHKSATLQDVEPDTEAGVELPRCEGLIHNPNPMIMTPASPGPYKKVQLPKERVIDMSPEDQKQWEEEEMNQKVTFDHCHIDPAPFQLVEKTSLLKVHSIFSLVGVNHAYVTAIGKLIGVVALKELRKAIEDSNCGNVPASQQQQQQQQSQAQQQPPHLQSAAEHLLSNEKITNNTSINSTISIDSS
ncbi:Chloride channel protein 2 [Homalodisca vitripennis]|nr:Chloride channel protein 2 [Homalodisca vitripennis]